MEQATGEAAGSVEEELTDADFAALASALRGEEHGSPLWHAAVGRLLGLVVHSRGPQLSDDAREVLADEIGWLLLPDGEGWFSFHFVKPRPRLRAGERPTDLGRFIGWEPYRKTPREIRAPAPVKPPRSKRRAGVPKDT